MKIKSFIVNVEINDADLNNLDFLAWLNEIFEIVGSNLDDESWNFSHSSYNWNELLEESHVNI